MKLFISILTLFSITNCLAQFYEEDFINGTDTIPPKMAELTLENLQGVWKKASRRRYDLFGDEPYETVPEYNHILIEGNNIWEFEYPIQMYSLDQFEIKDGIIVFTNEKNLLKNAPVIEPTPNFGTSGKCNYGVSENKKTLCYGGENYYKDSLDLTVIDKLKSGKFNTDCLSGNWQLKTSYDSGYDGHGEVNFIYPWKLPAKMNISPESVHRFYGAGLFYLKINGEKRPFTLEAIHVNEYYGKLVITPYKWHKDKDYDYDQPFKGVHTSSVTYEIYSEDNW